MTNDKTSPQQWTQVIKPKRSWFDIDLRELWRYRDLVYFFVKRDFVAYYKQTILGPLWFILQPLFNTIVFTVVFGKIADIPTDGIPHIVFYMAGIVAWNYFAECLNKTSNTFVSNAKIFGKVYFPRLAVPLSVVLSNLLTFAIQFLLFLGFLADFYIRGAEVQPNNWIWIMPLLLLQMAMLGLGMGIIISSLTTRYRDLSFAVTFGVSLWMYATPIVYPLSQVPEKWQALFQLNPMTAIVETFRYAFLGAGSADWSQLAVSFSITLAVLLTGLILFSRVEKDFMDTV